MKFYFYYYVITFIAFIYHCYADKHFECVNSANNNIKHDLALNKPEYCKNNLNLSYDVAWEVCRKKNYCFKVYGERKSTPWYIPEFISYEKRCVDEILHEYESLNGNIGIFVGVNGVYNDIHMPIFDKHYNCRDYVERNK